MNAYCYGKKITEVVEFVEDLVVFRTEDEQYNMVGLLEDVEVKE